MIVVCPLCEADLTYTAGDKEYSRVLGVEIPEVYDGVLYWVCPDCNRAWPRVFGIERRDRAAREEVARHNAIIEARQGAADD